MEFILTAVDGCVNVSTGVDVNPLEAWALEGGVWNAV
jgi:hypothetical protein